MTHAKKPSEIARESLKRLVADNLPLTPENYQACYCEIAELPIEQPFPESQLQRIAAVLQPRNVAQKKALARLDTAITQHRWQGVENALIVFINAGAAETSDPDRSNGLALPAEFSQELAKFIDSTLRALGEKKEWISETASELVQTLRKPPVNAQLIQDLLANAGHQALISAEEQVQIKNSLLNLMHLILENVSQLTHDETWLKGQIDGLLAIVTPPITLRHLDDMERCLREVIVKQGEARRKSIQAREEMRTMLTTFVEGLVILNKASEAFQGEIEESSRKIKMANTIEDIGPLLQDVIEATRAMSEGTSQTHSQLKLMQEKVEATELTLMRLYAELDSVSAQARHDPLTDALNRKGLDDALSRAIANSQRTNMPLSISMLDIDNFKKLNDRLGHEAGDKALIHLANVSRQCIRPKDTLARYGGEEFVILMPDTQLADGIAAITRLQRELTRIFFLSDNEKILITFSAGVAQVGKDECGVDAIHRADQAMYLAKRAGKNRVMGS